METLVIKLLDATSQNISKDMFFVIHFIKNSTKSKYNISLIFYDDDFFDGCEQCGTFRFELIDN